MNMAKPKVLKSKYVKMNESGTYEISENAPPDVQQEFREYQAAISSAGFLEAEDLPKIPPLNR